MNSIDTTLNCAWALLCIGAVVCHWRWERRNLSVCGRRFRVYRALSLFLVSVALFPCISASDDLVRLRGLETPAIHGVVFDRSERNNFPLTAQLDAIEHGQTATPFVLSFGWCSSVPAAPKQFGVLRSIHRDAISRAPPTLF